MSVDMPIREKKDEFFENKNDSSGSKPDKPKEINPSHDNHAHHIEHHPIPGKTFIIRTREKPHRILSLNQGTLEFRDRLNPVRGVYWQCRRKGHWRVFRNTTSGTYLGHDESGNVLSTKICCKEDEFFVPIRQEGGGYILHTFHPDQNELRQVAIAEDGDGSSLRVQDKGGTPLDFIDAKYVRNCVALKFSDTEGEFLLVEE
ncbi:hypothetical protein H0G86_013132 [Trichoderma simmonsii]|uniref:Uncharacterized protein n=1 Tax=Trichoderma simmonsii TaxID=1491479 RepID=A0A8G0LRQ7_9HYPO|nr:hypothetical protein H0G86_013132 [Trichoderma simmonsii]